MATSASQPTQCTGTNVITKPPAPMAPPGQPQLELMPRPEAPTGCPPGLEYLTQLDQILLYTQAEFGSFSVKYQIKNALGQQIYYASLNTFAICEPLVTHIFDNTGQEVMSVIRHFQYCANSGWRDLFQLSAENSWSDECCKYFALSVTVEAPPGQPIGHVRQRGSTWKPQFDIYDTNFEPLLKFQAPCICGHFFCFDYNVDPILMSYDESTEIGKISKEWDGSGCFSGGPYLNNKISLTFPEDLDVKVKGILFGALF